MTDSIQEDRQAIDHFIEQLTKAFVDRDLDRFLELYDDNVVCLPPGQQPIIGKSAWRESLSRWWDSLNIIENSETRHVDVVGGDLAVEWHTERMVASFGDGNPSESFNKGMFVLRRQQDNSWKIIYYCWNKLPEPS